MQIERKVIRMFFCLFCNNSRPASLYYASTRSVPASRPCLPEVEGVDDAESFAEAEAAMQGLGFSP